MHHGNHHVGDRDIDGQDEGNDLGAIESVMLSLENYPKFTYCDLYATLPLGTSIGQCMSVTKNMQD